MYMNVNLNTWLEIKLEFNNFVFFIDEQWSNILLKSYLECLRNSLKLFKVTQEKFVKYNRYWHKQMNTNITVITKKKKKNVISDTLGSNYYYHYYCVLYTYKINTAITSFFYNL